MAILRLRVIFMVFISTQYDTGSSVVQSSTQVTSQLQCLPGWSKWINTDTPSTGDGDKEGWSAVQKLAFCQGGGKITAIECKTTTDIAYYSTGEINLCTIEDGSVCLNDNNFPVPCSDYMIRYQCSCAEITTHRPLTKASVSSVAPSVTASVATSMKSYVTSQYQATRRSQGNNHPYNGASFARETRLCYILYLLVIYWYI